MDQDPKTSISTHVVAGQQSSPCIKYTIHSASVNATQPESKHTGTHASTARTTHHHTAAACNLPSTTNTYCCVWHLAHISVHCCVWCLAYPQPSPKAANQPERQA